MVPIENLVEWHHFTTLLRKAIPQLASPWFVYLLDHGKVYLCICYVFPIAYHCHCTWHTGDIWVGFEKSMERRLMALYMPPPLICLRDAWRGLLRGIWPWMNTLGALLTISTILVPSFKLKGWILPFFVVLLIFSKKVLLCIEVLFFFQKSPSLPLFCFR